VLTLVAERRTEAADDVNTWEVVRGRGGGGRLIIEKDGDGDGVYEFPSCEVVFGARDGREAVDVIDNLEETECELRRGSVLNRGERVRVDIRVSSSCSESIIDADVDADVMDIARFRMYKLDSSTLCSTLAISSADKIC